MFSLQVSESFYLRNPNATALGRRMVESAVDLLDEIGYSQFTFKKLALSINSVEASIYRYFENKDHLLFYLVGVYWTSTNFKVKFYTQLLGSPAEKLNTTIDVLLGIEKAVIPGLNFSRYDKLRRITRKNYYFALTITENSERGRAVEKELASLTDDVASLLERAISRLAPSFRETGLMANTVINKSLYSVEELRATGLPDSVEGYERLAAFLKEVISYLR